MNIAKCFTWVLFWTVLVFHTVELRAQTIPSVIKTYVHTDSIRIGMPFQVSVTTEAPSQWSMIFPDQSFDFAPFEFVSMNYFPTVCRDSLCLDSAVYTLRTFAMDSLQTMKLKTWRLLNAKDSIGFTSSALKLPLAFEMQVLPDSLKLKETADFYPINTRTNWPLWNILLLTLGVLTVLSALLFGGKIRLYFLRRRWKKKYSAFEDSFSKLMNSSALEDIDRAAGLWKKWIVEVRALSKTSMTSKEILSYLNEGSDLEAALKLIDRRLYAGQEIPLDEAKTTLLAYSQKEFEHKLKSLHHA